MEESLNFGEVHEKPRISQSGNVFQLHNTIIFEVDRNALHCIWIPIPMPKMKTRAFLAPMLGVLLLFAACNRVTPNTAVAYNDAIVDVQAHVVAHLQF